MAAVTPQHRPPAGPQPPLVPFVVKQHVEQAAFLWAQRDTLMAAGSADSNVIAGIDRRLEANLDGLRIAGEAAWPFIQEQYEDYPEKGELFVFSFFAIERRDATRIAQALRLARQSQDATGLTGALSWLPAKAIGQLVREWITSADALERFLAVSACASHQVDPNTHLARLVRDTDARVRSSAYRLAGVLKRRDLVDALRLGLHDQDEMARARAAMALAQLGADPAATAALKKVAVSGRPESISALRSIVEGGPEKDVRVWLGELLKSPETAPLAVRGAGMLADRTILHWLIHQMRNPALAEAAGTAFLELFPQAREDSQLFSVETSLLGQPFADHFDDDPPYLPVADLVKEWAKTRGLL
ncbi:HEAT repeat domain-containing protein [Mesorhizobium sp. L-8-3]|uniref:HEAT repeat domain-containing protein n=1 Tax=Mesorhizobium sp. L-8-3 TaxID=2744522 RepID=UPI0019288C1E|nr:HEAT repeat domain-containing protein [Mesorhizobium sp. L-8-3]BCH25440.1 hypothetical protein MesoLjLb_52250 [Mesorhizobium sp. L-8-3]